MLNDLQSVYAAWLAAEGTETTGGLFRHPEDGLIRAADKVLRDRRGRPIAASYGPQVSLLNLDLVSTLVDEGGMVLGYRLEYVPRFRHKHKAVKTETTVLRVRDLPRREFIGWNQLYGRHLFDINSQHLDKAEKWLAWRSRFSYMELSTADAVHEHKEGQW